MENSSDLPAGLCQKCSSLAIVAFDFITLCRESDEQWSRLTDFLNSLKPINGKRGYYIVVTNEGARLVTDRKYAGADRRVALKRIKVRLSQQAEGSKRVAKQRALRRSEFVGDLRRQRSCPHCKTIFKGVHALNQHLRESLKKSCPCCGEILPFSKLKRHIISHNVAVYPCAVCPDVFMHETSRDKHRILHSRGRYVCGDCKYSFPTKQALKSHSSTHAVNACVDCGGVFRGQSCYISHTHHCSYSSTTQLSSAMHSCSECNSTFKDLSSLNEHINELGQRICHYCGNNVALDDFRTHLKEHSIDTIDCPICPRTFESLISYKSHIKLHATDKYSCDNCQQTFRNMATLAQHGRSHVTINLSCPTCKQLFKSQNCFDKHTERCATVPDKTEGLFTCPNCDMRFISYFYLRAHLQKSRTKVCQLCRAVIQVDTLKQHLEEHGVPVFQCDCCLEVYHSKSKLETHSKVHHAGPYVCVECKRSYCTAQALAVHTKVHRTFDCSGCDRRFDTNKCYVGHAKICKQQSKSKSITYICDYCSKDFKLKSSICQHIKSAHLYEQDLYCADCDKKFSCHDTLKEHKNTHSDVYRYKCPICSTQMNTKRGYERHLRSHSNQRQYSCPHCEQRFLTSSEKTRHVVSVHSDRRTAAALQCYLCSMKYTQMTNLKKHMRNKHNLIAFMFKCSYCAAELMDETGFEAHAQLHRREEPESVDVIDVVN